MKPRPDKVTTQNNVCKMLSKWDPIHDYSYSKYETNAPDKDQKDLTNIKRQDFALLFLLMLLYSFYNTTSIQIPN